jgi:hypothetical protein
VIDIQTELFWTGKQKPAVHGIVQEGRLAQPPPEKCDVNACANEPKPPRVTWFEPESDAVPDAEPGEESPLKKLLRDDDPPEEPWPPLDEDPRGRQSALVVSPDGAAMPGWFGPQFSLGISP